MKLISKDIAKFVSVFESKLRSVSKHYKLLTLALVVVLILLLVVGLTRCSNDAPSDVSTIYIVSSDNLEVHKKANANSRVVSLLPLDLEIEVLEEKSVKKTTWGRIDKMTLADGRNIRAGWIDLQYVGIPIEPEETEPVTEPVQEETPTVLVNMGTITAGKLNVRKGPDSKYETNGAYYNGDRVEILETQNVDGSVWGRTNLGWIGMAYVKMDGTPASEGEQSTDPNAPKLISNGSNTVLGYGVVSLGELNLRLGPDTEYNKVGTVTMGKRYAYYQLSEGWARIEGGWVSTEYFYVEGTTASNAMSGVVNTDDLKIRTGPNTSFQSIGTYQKGDAVEILGQVDAWGYTDKGWVFMSYVEPAAPVYQTGVCKITSGLNIRKEPNPDAEIVGSYSAGDGVNILEVQDNWGRTIQGWINLKYVTYESVG